MLSDDVLEFFESKNCAPPAMGMAVVAKGGWSGTRTAWQCTLYDRKLGFHIHTNGLSPVEAVANMVVRLGGNSEIAYGKVSGVMEQFEIALNGLNFALIDLRTARK